MYGKIVDGKFVGEPRKLSIDGTLIYNPTPVQLKAQGYKPVQTKDPGVAPAGKVYTPVYTNSGDAIVQSWKLETVPASPEKVLMLVVPQTINTVDIDDNTSLRMLSYYPRWENLCGRGYKAEQEGFKFQYAGKLYKTRQPGHTFQSQWIPGQGTSAIYAQVVESHAGTADDPIPVPDDVGINAFTYVVGKIYDEDGTLWKCQREGEVDGTEHSFVYKPSQAVGYFVQVQ